MRKLYYIWDNLVEFIKDLWWWVTDRKPLWDDAVECERKLCRHCGNYPLKEKKSNLEK